MQLKTRQLGRSLLVLTAALHSLADLVMIDLLVMMLMVQLH
jgi:hypothetical protein